MNVIKAYSFDDLLLIPKHSNIEHRADIDTSVQFREEYVLDIPIVSSNMTNVTGPEMAKKISALGGLAILHRFKNSSGRIQDFCNSIGLYSDANGRWIPSRNTKERTRKIGISIGTNSQEKEFLNTLAETFIKDYVKIICIDVAHGDHQMTIDMIHLVRQLFPSCLLIAGNVATGDGAVNLAKAGADIIKAGVGSGSICSTRIETGNGVPQMTVLEDVRKALDCFPTLKNVKIISDGGISKAGSIVKALCFADAVMIGNLLAGTNEAPGETILFNGIKHKQYVGSSTHKSSHVEGVSGLVPHRGLVMDVIDVLMQGVRSGMSYQGVNNLKDLKKDPCFVEISNSGLTESKPHDIILL